MGLHCGGHTPSSRDRAATNRGELRHARVRHAGDTPPEGFAWRKTPTATSVERAAGAEGQDGAPVGGGSPATEHAEGATTKQISPNKNHAAPLRDKTLPAHPLSPPFRDKTLPAHPKWPNLAQSTHAGRVLYRSHHQEAKQGEFCTERGAETGLANTTGHQAPPVWRVPEGPVWRAPEGPVWRAPEGPEGTGGLRGTEPGRGASG